MNPGLKGAGQGFDRGPIWMHPGLPGRGLTCVFTRWLQVPAGVMAAAAAAAAAAAQEELNGLSSRISLLRWVDAEVPASDRVSRRSALFPLLWLTPVCVCSSDRRFHPKDPVHATRPPDHIPPQPAPRQRCGLLQLHGRGRQGAEEPAHVGTLTVHCHCLSSAARSNAHHRGALGAPSPFLLCRWPEHKGSNALDFGRWADPSPSLL